MQNWIVPQTKYEQDEMSAGMSDLDRYYSDRDKPAPYVQTKTSILPSEPLPYNSPGEAITDLATSLAEVAVKLAPPAGKLAAIAGAGYFVLSAIGGACAAAMAWGAANATMIGAVLFGIVAVWVAKSSIQDKRANAAGQTVNSATAQSINVTVNVAGQNVNNGKQ